MQRIVGLGIVVVLVAVHLTCAQAQGPAQAYTFQTIDAPLPGLGWTRITGMTTRGSMVGTAFDTQAHEYSWLYRRNTKKFEVISQKGYPPLIVEDMNDTQRMSGRFVKDFADHAFTRMGGALKTLAIPGAVSAQAAGINNANVLVGTYHDAQGSVHGFQYVVSTKAVTILDYPGAFITAALGISDRDVVVGVATLPRGEGTPGWKLENGVYTVVEAPCPFPSWTLPLNINSDGLIAAQCGDDDGRLLSFVGDGETWTELAVPGAFVTWVRRVTASGQLVGWYSGQDGRDHGFIATPAVNTAPR